MRIGILGSGLMGGKLGTLFARTGHEVVFSYSRSRQKLDQLAREAGGSARLIRDVGFDPTDVGSLRSARYIEPFTMIIAKLAYEGEGRPELAYRFERFGAP